MSGQLTSRGRWGFGVASAWIDVAAGMVLRHLERAAGRRARRFSALGGRSRGARHAR